MELSLFFDLVEMAYRVDYSISSLLPGALTALQKAKQFLFADLMRPAPEASNANRRPAVQRTGFP